MPELFDILLVEDSDTDAEVTSRALTACAPSMRLNRVSDGSEAMQYLLLHGENDSVVRRAPDLVLLDLNLPNIDGREVLRRIRASDSTRTIPVVVLTTSASEVDVRACYQLYANAYVVKPIDYGEFVSAMESLTRFWMQIAKLPSRRTIA